MKILGLVIPLLAALACAPVQAASVMGSDLLSFTILSDTYVSAGAWAVVYGNVLSGDYGTAGANSSIYGNFQTTNVATAGAHALVDGNMQSILAGTIGDSARVTGNFQTGLVGTVGANAVVTGNFVTGLAGSTGANANVNGNFITGMVGSTGAGSAIAGNFDVGAGYAQTLGAGSTAGGIGVTNATATAAMAAMKSAMTSSFAGAIGELNSAKTTLSAMGAGTGLAATMTVDTTFKSGVYSAASFSTTAGTTMRLDGQGQDNQIWVFNIADILSTGASSKIELVNAGKNAQVFWNTNGYASLGASSTFLGTVLAETYISVGANTLVSNLGSSACGGLFSATSYVSIGANATVGGNGCSALPTIDITTPVPEPESYAMLLAGLGLIGTIVHRRTKPAA
jgi:hypothetical protein